MINREKRCSECLILQAEEMESPYVCEECECKSNEKYNRTYLIDSDVFSSGKETYIKNFGCFLDKIGGTNDDTRTKSDRLS